MTSYFVILSLLIIGVVYAILQANLQINGIAKIKSNSWDIHFNNIQVNQNSVSIGTGDSAATIDPTDTSKVDFSVTLSTPGDFYEFNVDVVNAGTIDGMIGELTQEMVINGDSVSELPDYLNYIVTYDGGDPILEKHLLEAGQTLAYKVRVEFSTNIEELPDACTISSTFGVQYIQADDTAIKKLPFLACYYDGEMELDSEYENGQYTYKYIQETRTHYDSTVQQYVVYWSLDGWQVTLTDTESTNPVTTRMCTTVNDVPVIRMSYMFSGSKTTSIDTSSFNTSNVVNMNGMFLNSTGITEIDVSGFDTSNVTQMSAMFQGCTGLTEIDISNFDSSNVTAVNSFAFGCSNLEYLNFSNFDFSLTGSLATFFGGPIGSNLKTIDLTNAILPYSMYLFFNGSSAEEIILDNVDTSNVTDMNWAFTGCRNLRQLDVSSFDTHLVTNFKYMFQDCSSLESIDLSGFDTSSLRWMSSMFSGCSSLTSLDLSSFDVTHIQYIGDISGVVAGCTSLTSLNLSNWDFSGRTFNSSLFGYMGLNSSNVEFLNLTNFKFPSYTQFAFYNLSKLKTVILDGVDTSEGTDFQSMFSGCSGLTSLDLSSFNTLNVTSMLTMFSNCTNLTSINLSSFDTSNVTNFTSMFYGCSSLTTLDLSSFDMTSVTDTGSMFSGCSSLTTGYARTSADANILNATSNKPSGLTFTLKS